MWTFVDSYRVRREITEKYKPLFRSWAGYYPIVHLTKPEYLEIVMNSVVNIKKSSFYDTLRPWLGDGLLTSSGKFIFSHFTNVFILLFVFYFRPKMAFTSKTLNSSISFSNFGWFCWNFLQEKSNTRKKFRNESKRRNFRYFPIYYSMRFGYNLWLVFYFY